MSIPNLGRYITAKPELLETIVSRSKEAILPLMRAIHGSQIERYHQFVDIPIFLVDHQQMKKFDTSRHDIPELHNEPVNQENRQKGELKEVSTDILGCFILKPNLLDCNSSKPCILLCLERMERCRLTSNDKELVDLAVTVLVHEFAHAIMSYNHVGNNIEVPDTTFYHWMEESLANYITLIGLSQIYHSSLPFAYKFMDVQPAAYRLGLNLFKVGIQIPWHKWQYKKEAAVQTANKEQNDAWLDYVQNNQDNLDPEKLSELYNAVELSKN